MNSDLIECKRRAEGLTSSQDPLYDANGKKKGYIMVVKELWKQERMWSPRLERTKFALSSLEVGKSTGVFCGY